MKTSIQKYIYVADLKGSGIKIGISSNPKLRISHLGKISSMWVTEESYEDAYIIEQTALSRLSRIGTSEFVRCSFGLAVDTVRESIQALCVEKEKWNLAEATRSFQREFIIKALAAHKGSVSLTSRSLGINRTHLYKLFTKLGILDWKYAET